MTSAYPTPVDVLIPQAQQWAADLGHIPSRNRLMTQFKIGAKKATRLRAALTPPTPTPPAPTSAPVDDPGQPFPAGAAVSPGTASPGSRLHAVPDVDPSSRATHDASGRAHTEPSRPPADPTPAVPTGDDSDRQEPLLAASDATRHSGSLTTAPATVVPMYPAAPPPAAPAATVARSTRARPGWSRRLPLILLALPAFVAIWSGWVGLGELTGFGPVHPLPGIWNGFTLNTAITLPIGVETYAAYALRVWLSGSHSSRTRRYAKVSALGSLGLGAAGQIAYHLMSAAQVHAAPWLITTVVACLPVVVLGFAAALDHLQHPDPAHPAAPQAQPATEPTHADATR